MDRTLLLIRHAKAVNDGSADIVRQLAPRGVSDAQVAGLWLVEHDLMPDHVVVSPALRAIETWDAVASAFGDAPALEVDSRIYDNDVESLLAVINDVDPEHATIALVGHNPAMQQLAYDLDDGSGAEELRDFLSDDFPTNGIAILDVDVDWADVNVGAARLRDFVAPRAEQRS